MGGAPPTQTRSGEGEWAGSGARWTGGSGRGTVTTASRRWFGGRDESRRADAQAAKDAAAAAFYELDSAQRELRISVETIAAADGSPAARQAGDGFVALGERIDQVSRVYIEAVDAHDLDRPELDASVAARATRELTGAREELDRAKAELDRFALGLRPLLEQAETRLARVAPARERARAALLAASDALDAVRATGMRADELAARLAALGPELTKLNEGAGRHGVQETVRRADRILRDAEAVRAEAARLPERAAEIDRRLVSLRTRAQALHNRAGRVEPVLSELRRRFSAACWQDLQQVPDQAVRDLARAGDQLREAARAREEQRWADVGELIEEVRGALDATDEAVSAAQDRLTRLEAVARDPQAEVERTRFAIRDAQRLAMEGRTVPDPKDAGPLDEAVARVGRAVTRLEGLHPDYWAFLQELEDVRVAVNRVVSGIRAQRGHG
ncbi:hypothetical protein [Streptomyces sp. NPDC051567]|uniref:hypothetical protein n=1 Tax=Streptomyces sp. NPDC051567 TaxID=3365660 RepID=UPI0037AFDA3F